MVQALRRNCGCFGLCFKEKPKWFSKDILVGALSAKLLQELHSHAPELLDRDFLRSAVEVTPEALWYADSTLKSDTELVKALSCRRAESLQYADAELRSNQKFLLALIEQNGACLKFCSEALLQNHDFNLKALQQNSLARDHVDAKLWADTSFVLKALECLEISTRTALEKVGTKHPELLADWNFALQAVERRGSALEFLSAFYQDDRAVVSVAMEDDPQALAFASPLLREDRVLVQSALRKDGSVLSHAGPGIQDTVTLVLEATKTTPSAFQFASERVRKDQDVVWQALKISPQVLAFSPLAADGNFVLSAAIHFEAAVQFAAEVLLSDLGFCLSCVAQNCAVLSFLPNELRASASFVEAAVRANGEALYFAPQHFQSDPSLIRLSDRNSGATYPSILSRDAETLQQHGVPLERLGGPVQAVAAGNRVLSAWERLERLSPKALQEECSMRGLPEASLEWYGADFLMVRLKKLVLLQELPLQELRRSVDVTGSSANANAMHSLRVGSSVRVVEDFFSIGNVKLKQGLVGKVMMIDQMDAKIDFREQNTSAGTFAAQWVYQKDFVKLKVEEDEEGHSILLNEHMIDLFAGVYERKGVPVRSLQSFPAASTVLERWESLADMQDNQMSTEFLKIFGIGPGSTVRRDAQEAALRSAELWREMPLPQLLKECEARRLGVPHVALSHGQLADELRERLLGSLCQDLYKAEGLDLQHPTWLAVACESAEREICIAQIATFNDQLLDFNIGEKEQRDRLKKVSFWKALPFTALREQCWNMGMRSAYFNSADFGNDKLVREAVWHQFLGGYLDSSPSFRGPNHPFEYFARPLVPAHIRSGLQRLLLPNDASVEDVKKAYRKLALKPDDPTTREKPMGPEKLEPGPLVTGRIRKLRPVHGLRRLRLERLVVNVSNSLILVIAITWGGGEKLNGSGLTLIVLEAFIYPLSLLLMAYNFSLLFTQVEFAVKVLPITNLLLGTIPTSAIYILNMTGNQTAAQVGSIVMSVVNPVYGLPGVIVMMMSSPPTSLLGHFTAPEAIPMYGSIMMCVMLASNLIYQDARSRSAVPGRCQDFDAARKDDDVLAEEQRVDQSLMNQISQERSQHACMAVESCAGLAAVVIGSSELHRCSSAGHWALLGTPVAQLTYDPIARPCCRAQKAWDQLVADGGCGGPDGAGPSQGNCDAALELCMDCEAAVQYYAQNATALGTRNVSVDISSTRVTCELPQWDPSNCVKGFGVGLLITTGVSLLVVASLACIAFDWRLLPSLVARQRRKLLVDAITVQNQIHAELDGCASPSAPPKPKPVPPAPPTPTARPQGFANAANECALRAAASVANVAAGTGTAELTLAELAASPTSPALDAAFAACGALVEEAPEPAPKAGPCRPRHYASAYALHGAFLVIACLAVLLRVSYVVCRGLLVVGLRSAHQCLPELLLCILPFAWVTCTSRRPKSSTSAVPKSIAYWGPWQAIPRFTTYAVCTICTEIYSTLVAALAVARLPCNASPLAGVLLYCVGLLVAVVRAYCCVLALRLQDELASVCRPATAPASTTEGAAGMTTARCPVAGANGAWDAPEGQRENQEKTGSRATSWRRATS
ncbi:Peptidylprolyl isomerase [Durusdinium trenchii]|uniref:Peptidylprolyl isomerase n=1 Tax=Durusdinium trenchii TaxID=1381693 RepID=A0ABP0KP15_9DINO